LRRPARAFFERAARAGNMMAMMMTDKRMSFFILVRALG
jgi:hypothetical protein